MAGIFISYAQQSVGVAKTLAGQLQASGFEVWWDINLRGRQRFDDVIREQIEVAHICSYKWLAYPAPSVRGGPRPRQPNQG